MADPSIERFRRVVAAAFASLEARRQEVNDLNVFPVADGDTGDNMAMTMRAVMEELDRLDGQTVDEVGRTQLVQALARAALMGARGNSGFAGEEIIAWGGAGSTLAATVERLAEGAELVTVFGGTDAPIPLDGVGVHTREGVELEVHDGGQPSWWWLLSAQ